MKNFKSFIVLIMAAALVLLGNLSAFGDDVEVVFSLDGGLYTAAQTLTLSATDGATIYYTTDGSLPDSNSSVYYAPIELKERYKAPRTIQGQVSQERAPYGTVVRAVATTDSGEKSNVVTNTYIIAKDIFTLYETPVVALTFDPYDLWDGENGIYTNYDYEHNVKSYFEIFTADEGKTGAERSVEAKVSGHGSRSRVKKSIRIYLNKTTDSGAKKNLEYDLIPGTIKNFFDNDPVTKFAKITFRLSDWDSSGSDLMRDPFAQELAKYTRADTASSTPAALFLNGEFWGVYEMREQYDDRYIANHYDGIDNSDVVYFNRDWTLEADTRKSRDSGERYTDKLEYSEGPENGNDDGVLGEDYYRDLVNYVNDLITSDKIGDEEVFAELCQYIDIDDFIDYCTVYMVAGNDDWPGNNFKFWRTTEEQSDGASYGRDGKFRFLVHDFDIAFGSVEHETLALMTGKPTYVSQPNSARHPEYITLIMAGFFKNKTFRDLFAQRYLTYLSTAYSGENARAVIERMVSEREYSKVRDMLRWNMRSGTSFARLDRWKEYCYQMADYVAERADVEREAIAGYFNEYCGENIQSFADVTFRTDTNLGFIEVSGAQIRSDLYGDKANRFTALLYAGIPVYVRAVANDGYTLDYFEVKDSEGTKKYTASDCANATLEYTAESDTEITAYFKEGEAPKDELSEIRLMREGIFDKLKVGERMPINIMGKYAQSGWQKLFDFECEVVSGDAVTVRGNMLDCVKKGAAVVRVKCGSLTLDVNIAVK